MKFFVCAFLVLILSVIIAGAVIAESDTDSNKSVQQVDESTSEQKDASEESDPIWGLVPLLNPDPEFIKDEEWKEFRNHIANGGKWIWVDLRCEGQNQTFALYEGTKKIRCGYVSGAALNDGRNYNMPKDKHPEIPHNHPGIHEIWKKFQNYWSKEFDCPMKYSLFYCNGHALHATTENNYSKLGRPASHGCTRMKLDDAEFAFKWAADAQVKVWVRVK